MVDTLCINEDFKVFNVFPSSRSSKRSAVVVAEEEAPSLSKS